MSRLVGLLVVLLVVGGCSPQADPATPAERPAPESSPAAAPYHVGAELPRGERLAESVRAVVTGWPSVGRARAYAARLAGQLARYRGDYDIALKETGPRTYARGDRGRGELQRVSLDGWRGTGLRRVFHYVFDDLARSANVLGGHFVLRRGRYVVDLEWEAPDQQTDRRLSHLPRRLIRGLG